MRNYTILGTLGLLIVLIGWGTALGQGYENLLLNGGFEDGVLDPWTTYGNTFDVVMEDPIEGNYCVRTDIAQPGANFWDVFFKYPGLVFENGKHYTFAAFLRCDSGEQQIMLKPELDQAPNTGYGAETVTITDQWQEYYVTTPVFTGNVTPADVVFLMAYDAGTVWIDNVRLFEGDYVPPVIETKTIARNPSPETGATDVAQDASLSWIPGPYASTHDVYLGTSFNDVNQADASSPLGVLVSAGQTEPSYTPTDLLYGTTYYWRVDEVNGAPDHSVFKGDVWDFTTEPYYYPVTPITATASSDGGAGYGPDNTINESGLKDDLHATDSAGKTDPTGNMWKTADGDVVGAWIQYEFDGPKKIETMLVWNANPRYESILGVGIKEATIETSLDGQTWTDLAGTLTFNRATGLEDDPANTTIDFGGRMATYVRINVVSHWADLTPTVGLSEVRFYHLPLSARHPQPAPGSFTPNLAVELNWRAGREAANHELYVSKDRTAVADSNAAALVGVFSDHHYDLSGFGLEYNTNYFWKVIEVNENGQPTRIEGPVWDFSTPEFRVLEDFEGYNDDCNRIYFSWLDGLGYDGDAQCGVDSYGGNGTGSTVGNFNAPFAERTIVHSGSQAMPMEYDNSASPFYSEAQSAGGVLPTDWTVGGVDTLSIHVAARSVPFAEPSPGHILMNGLGADIYNLVDEFRFVYQELNGNGSIVARLDSVEDVDQWTKAGLMIRSGLQPVDKQVMIVGNPRDRVEWAYRPDIAANTAGADTGEGSTPFPHYLRLLRAGNTITAEHSADGVSWEQINGQSSITIDLPSKVYIGLVVSSHDSVRSAAAEFSEVKVVNPDGSKPWQMAEIGVDQPVGNDAAPLYLVVEDGTGATKILEHPDGNILQSGDWQAWDIAFSELSPLNLSNIKKVSVGVGDRNNLQAGGQGKLYIDDLRLKKTYPPYDLVAYYALENNVEDSSGNHYHGTAVGDPVYVTGADGIGLGLEFDGTVGQYVDLGHFNPSRSTGQLSLSLWVRWNGLNGSYQGLISKRDAWDAGAMMWQIEANQDTGELSFARNGSTPADGDPVLVVGEWTHVAVTFDGSVSRFYINGVLTGWGNFSLGSSTRASIQLGASEAGGVNPFNGALDEVRIYDRVLSDTEIQTLAGL